MIAQSPVQILSTLAKLDDFSEFEHYYKNNSISDADRQLAIFNIIQQHKAGEDPILPLNFLISRVANLNFQDEKGKTPLILACERGFNEILVEIIKHFPLISQSDKEGIHNLNRQIRSLLRRQLLIHPIRHN